MALVEDTLFGKKDKVKIAIDRIRNFDPLSLGISDQPYYVAYSGGKDSDAIRILCELAGVKHDLVNNHTSVDAPETVRYIRTIPNIQIEYPEYKGERMTMWKLIPLKKIPPTRIQRYCCQVLKEQGGRDRIVMTGVRWAESVKRKHNRSGVEIQGKKPGDGIMLNADNDESRRMFETCTMKGKRVVNPIIDWTDLDVWEFLHHYKCKSNPLYQCGYKRVGCIGCPMSTKQASELRRYPKYKAAYIRAFDKMLEAMGDGDRTWNSGEDVFAWWLDRTRHEKQLEGQIGFEV